MDNPEFVASGKVNGDIHKITEDLMEIVVGGREFKIDPAKEYDVEISERRPKVIEEIASFERANSGTHYRVLHANGDPVDPAAKCFVIRFDNPDDHSLAAYRAYAESLRRHGKRDEADAMIAELPERCQPRRLP